MKKVTYVVVAYAVVLTFNIEMFCIASMKTCDIIREDCIDKPANSNCTRYDTYFNYNGDVEYLLQLEYEVMNYIEVNVTNQYCRNHLKAALCVTIYPPCDGDGVQKLCTEECHKLLNSEVCLSYTKQLSDYATGKISSFFTFNCSNSLENLNAFSNTTMCESSNCVPLLQTAETPAMCMPFPHAHLLCGQYIENNTVIYIDPNVYNYTEISNRIKELDGIEVFGKVLSCRWRTLYMICLSIYPRCNITTQALLPPCMDDCLYYASKCDHRSRTLIAIAALNSDVTSFFYLNCSAPFRAFSSPNVDTENCYSFNPDDYVPSKRKPTEPIKTTTASITNNIITVTYNDTNRVTSDGHKHTNIPVIVGSITSGILGLCIILCTVTLILKGKNRRKKHIKLGRFTFVSFNPLFHRRTSKPRNASIKDERTFNMKMIKQQFQDLLLPKCEIKLTTKLGEGEFGLVYKGTWIHTTCSGNTVSEVVAVKTIKNYNSMEVLECFLNESVLMKNFNHPNVLNILGVGLDADNDGLPFIVLPFMANGNLKMYLQNKRLKITNVDQLPEGMKHSSLFDICHQIACGMKYLAAKRLIHRDLAARNCMVGTDLSIKVADFGLAKDVYMTEYYRQQNIEKMPVKWMAPEAFHDRITNEKTDVWSYGVTCWEVFSLGRTPYPTIPNEELLQYIDEGNRLSKPELCGDDMYSLMLKCWEADVESRVCFGEIVTELSEEVSKGYVIESLDDIDVQIDNFYTVL